MDEYFCKKSVFCILYLVFFFLGTICGVLLFWYFSGTHAAWIRSYCSALADAPCPGPALRLLFVSWPLLAVIALGIMPVGKRLILPFVLFRGILLAYSAAAFYICGRSFGGQLLWELAVLPVFFYLCERFYEKPCICSAL